jgi:hypothetical protein
MAENGTLTLTDPDGYTAAFGDARINLTITGAGDFNARLTRLKLKHLEVYRCCETLPRIAYLSLPPERVFRFRSVPHLSYLMDLLCEAVTWFCTALASVHINDLTVHPNGV